MKVEWIASRGTSGENISPELKAHDFVVKVST